MITSTPAVAPGLVVIFGSGETSPSGQKVFDTVLRRLPPGARVAILETPAGFELNSPQVAGRVADFLRFNLQNYRPQPCLVAARARHTPASPDDPLVTAPILDADLVFMGPGSPTYTVRQLNDSLALHRLTAAHRMGVPLVLASAAAIAISLYALPVYEIYKAGEDLHWKPGLDFFGPYGLPLLFIPHWNNNDGGEDLDTSRCFMGRQRLEGLVALLPADLTVVGIDEKTAVIMDLQAGLCQVIGQGGITLIHTGHEHDRQAQDDVDGPGLAGITRHLNGHVHWRPAGLSFPLSEIGAFHLPDPAVDIPAPVWAEVEAAQRRVRLPEAPAPIPTEVQALVEARQQARLHKDWVGADALRQQITALGWQVKDTPKGPLASPLASGLASQEEARA